MLALVENEHIRSFSAANLRWMLTSAEKGAYEPLAWLVFALIHALFGLSAAAFHAASLLVHACGALLVYGLARRLTACGPWAAFAAAAFYGLHPLQIETVAQAASLGDVLAAALALLSLRLYLERKLRASCAAFAASALCHWQGVALPAVFLLLDVLVERRREPWRRLLAEKAPFLVVVGLLVAVTLAVKAGGARPEFPLGAAPHGLLLTSTFFLAKTLVPAGLKTLHYLSGPLAGRPLPWAAGAAAFGGLSLLAWRGGRSASAAWLSYLLLLAPTSVLVWGGNLAVSTRYGYLALAAPALLLPGLLKRLRAPEALAAAGLAVVLAPLARSHARVYKDAGSILARDVRSDPALAGENLRSPEAAAGAAMRLFEDGHGAEGLTLLRWAVDHAPDDARLRNDLGVQLAASGLLDEASREFEAAARLAPQDPAIRSNLERSRKRPRKGQSESK